MPWMFPHAHTCQIKSQGSSVVSVKDITSMWEDWTPLTCEDSLYKSSGLRKFPEMCFWIFALGPFSGGGSKPQIYLSEKYLTFAHTAYLNRYFLRLVYLEMFIKLVHKTCEELIGILLFSDIQLFVPHLEDLQPTNQVHRSTNQFSLLVGLQGFACFCLIYILRQNVKYPQD